MNEHIVGIDLGTSVLRAVVATQDGVPSVARALPAVLATDHQGRWLVGHAAQAELVANPGRVLHRWKVLLAPDGSEDAPRQRLGRLLSALRHEVERATGGLAHAAVLAVPTPWIQSRFGDVLQAAQMAGLHPDRILPRADALALALAPPVAATVAVLTLDAEGVEAALFEVEPGTVQPLQRARSGQYTLDALDDLLFSMMPGGSATTARAAAALSLGAWRTALLRGDTALWDDTDPSLPPLSLSSGQRTACLEFFSDAAVAQLHAALRSDGRGLADVDQIVLADLYGEAEAFRAAITQRIACRIVRAHPDDAATGAARFARGLHTQGRRWIVRASGTGFAAVAGLHSAAATPHPPTAIAPTHTPAPTSAPPTAPPTAPPAAPSTPPARSSWTPVVQAERPMVRPMSSLPPARPSEAPTALALSGTFVGHPTPQSLLALPLAQPPRTLDEPWPLTLLLLRIERARLPLALLTLQSGRRSATLHIERSRPTVHPSDRTEIREILGWDAGTFSIRTQGETLEPPVVQWSSFGFIVEAMQGVLRAARLPELEEALAAHLYEAPQVAESKQHVVHRLGLSDREQRMIANELDGRRSLHDLLHGGTASRASLLQLLCLLSAWNALAWAPPPVNAADDPLVRLRAARTRAAEANFLDVLGVHWSVGPQEIAAAWKAHQERYGPGSRAARLSPTDAAALYARGEAAYEALRDDLRRVRYVHATLPDVSYDQLAPLVQGRAMSLSMQRTAVAEFQDAMRLLRELSPSLYAETEKIVARKLS